MKKYYYKTGIWPRKLILPLLLISIGIILVLYIPVDSEFTALLISLFYISGFILLIFVTLPLGFHSLKNRRREIVINDDSILFFNSKYSTGDKKETIVNREDILRLELKSQTGGKFIIPSEGKITEIEDGIYKMPGRKLIIYSSKFENKSKCAIYLELLDKKFLFDFINWYQDRKVGDDY